jgi:uncharacterized protein YhjY with autotransporter beta-barrel domain
MSLVSVVLGRNGCRLSLSPVFAPLRRWLSRSAFRIPVLPLVALFLGVIFLGFAQPARAQPYTLSFESYPASITAGSTVDFRVRVVDSGGNPVPFVSVLFNVRAKTLTFSPVRSSNINGIATLTWSFAPVGDYDNNTDVRAFVFDGSLQSNPLNGALISIVTGNTPPAAPTGVSATQSPSFPAADVTFTAPGYAGSPALTSYTVTASPGGASSTCLGSPCTVGVLTVGTSYTFTVTANSPAGSGPASAPSAPLTILSDNTDLAGLAVSAGTLSPAFNAIFGNYSISVPNSVSSFTFTPVTADPAAVISYNGNIYASGTPFTVSLNVGSNFYSFSVRAPNGALRAYTLVVTRALSSNAALSGLSVSAGALSPAFSSGVTDYTVSVPFGVTTFSLTPTLADAAASLRVNGANATSGAGTAPSPLALGLNVFTVQTTAQDGVTVSTYRLNVTRGQAIGTLVLTASSSANIQGAPVTLEANYTGPVAATGTVTFLNGTTPLATVALSGNRASLTLTTLPPGSLTLTARYNGDSTSQAVTSAPVTVVVNSRPNPANDASVRAQVSAQINTALRFSQTQIASVTNRLEQLHDRDNEERTPDAGPGGMGTGLSGGTPGGRQNRVAAPGSGAALAEATTRSLESGGAMPALSRGHRFPDGSLSPGLGLAGGNLPGSATPPQNDLARGLQQMTTFVPAFAQALNRQGSLPFQVWAGTSIGIGRPRLDGTYNQRFTNAHFVVGMDRRFTPDLTAGLALSSTFDNVDIGSDNSRIRGFSPAASLYASWRVLPQTYLDVLGGAGLVRFDTQRFSSAGGVMLDGDRHGRNIFGSVGLTRRFTKDDWTVSLYGRFDVMAAWLDGYAEKGDPLWAVRYGSSFIQSHAAVIGGRFGYDIRQSWGTLTPLLRLEYRHNFQGGYTQAVGYLDGFSPGVITGSGSNRGQMSGGAGLRARIGSDLAFELGYLASGTPARLEMHRFTGSIRYDF